MKSDENTPAYRAAQSSRRLAAQTKRRQAPPGKAGVARPSALAYTLGKLFVAAHERIKAAPAALEDATFREHVTNVLGDIAKEELSSSDWRRLPVHRQHRAILIAVANTYFRDPK